MWVYRRWLVPQPSYWLRRLTRGMPEPRATRFIEWYVPKAMTVSGALGRVPRIGRWLRRVVPVADYRDRLPLTPEQVADWALMDTHDMLITRYTYPQRWKDLRRWMRDLEDVRKPNAREMSAVGRRPSKFRVHPSTGLPGRMVRRVASGRSESRRNAMTLPSLTRSSCRDQGF